MSDESTPLLDPERAPDRRLSRLIQKDDAASSVVKSHTSVDEQALASSTVGERLAYNDYTTIDWLHDLVSLFCCTVFFFRLPYQIERRRADTCAAYRSKIPTAFAASTTRKISKEKHLPYSTHHQAG